MGDKSKGATRWVEIAGIRFQPSELGKILLILFFAYFFAKYQESVNRPKVLIGSFILAGIPLALIKKEPDLSTTIVTALIFLVLLFMAGLSYKFIATVLAVSVPSAAIFLALILQPDQKILRGYQYKRIMGWLQPEKYADDAYQQQNSIMAIGSGQLLGKGLYNTDVNSVKNGNFISEPQTDFIFSIISEEFGFLGVIIVATLFITIIYSGFKIAMNCEDKFGKYLAFGITFGLAFQTMLNLMVVVGLIPVTGVTLPFLSYGGSSLLISLTSMGILLNISNYHN